MKTSERREYGGQKTRERRTELDLGALESPLVGTCTGKRSHLIYRLGSSLGAPSLIHVTGCVSFLAGNHFIFKAVD